MNLNEPVVLIDRLCHHFGQGELRKQILFDIDLEIRPGEFVIMTGPSGSGKSTLLSLIGCLLSVQAGSLKVLNQELNGASDNARAEVRRNFGFVFQASNLVKFLTAERNIYKSLELNPQFNRQVIRQRTQEILAAVGLADRAHHYPAQLSGGQQQRIAIACALAHQPKLLLADEPTAALDSKSGRTIVELMHRLAKEQGSAVLLVTHDPRILDVADRIIQVEDGRLGLAYRQELSLALPGLREEQIEAITIKPTFMTYEPGALVFRQGDPADKFYVVIQGNLEVFSDPDQQQNQEKNQENTQAVRILNHLSRGDYFGEMGLLQAGIRTASVRVTVDEPAKLMVMEREVFQTLVETSSLTSTAIAQQVQQRVNSTLLSEALPSLNLGEIMQLLPEVEVLKYGTGSNIIAEGDPAEYFYIIMTGQVEVMKQNSSDQIVKLRELGPGNYFGEIGLIEGRSRTATVRVISPNPVEVIALKRETFEKIMTSSNSTKAMMTAVVKDHFQNQIAKLLYNRLRTQSVS
jgi:sulfate-transporting ATPase